MANGNKPGLQQKPAAPAHQTISRPAGESGQRLSKNDPEEEARKAREHSEG